MAEDVLTSQSLERRPLTSHELRWRQCQSSLSASQGSGYLPSDKEDHKEQLLKSPSEQLPAPKEDLAPTAPPNLIQLLKNHSHPQINIPRENGPSNETHQPYRWQDANLAGHRSACPFNKSAEDLQREHESTCSFWNNCNCSYLLTLLQTCPSQWHGHVYVCVCVHEAKKSTFFSTLEPQHQQSLVWHTVVYLDLVRE